MSKIPSARLAAFFRRMATSYRAGIDLRSILKQEMGYGSGAYRKEIRVVHAQVSEGESLAAAIAKQKGAFPPLAIAIVDAGERGGRLEESFDRLAKHYDNLVMFRRRLFALLAWPIFELTLSIVVLGLLIIVMEWVASANNQPSVDWLGFGKKANGENRVSTAGYLLMYMGFIFFSAVFVATLVMGTSRGLFGSWPMRIARHIPLLGKIIVQLAMSRFGWTLGVAIDAGLSAMNATQLALRSTQNFFYARHENDVALRIRAGNEIHTALKETGEFPEEVIMYVENGETAGEVPEMMKHLSDTYQDRAETNMRTLAVVGFVLMFLFIAMLIIAAIFFLFVTFILGPIKEAAGA